MRSKLIIGFILSFAFVVFGAASAEAQVVGAVKDAASKTKDVTVEATKKTTVVVTNAMDDTASKTKQAAEKTTKTTKAFGNNALTVSEGVAGKSYEGGKWATVTTWDGTKWVSKRVWFETKKGASATKQAIN